MKNIAPKSWNLLVKSEFMLRALKMIQDKKMEDFDKKYFSGFWETVARHKEIRKRQEEEYFFGKNNK